MMGRCLRFLLAGVAALAIAGCGTVNTSNATNCSERGDDIACTDLGPVRGAVDGPTMGFKAIPYASPPVGALRWRPPQPAQRWIATRDGSRD